MSMIASAKQCANGDGLVTVSGKDTDSVLTGKCAHCGTVAEVLNVQLSRGPAGELKYSLVEEIYGTETAPVEPVAAIAPVDPPIASAVSTLHDDDKATLAKVYGTNE